MKGANNVWKTLQIAPNLSNHLVILVIIIFIMIIKIPFKVLAADNVLMFCFAFLNS